MMIFELNFYETLMMIFFLIFLGMGIGALIVLITYKKDAWISVRNPTIEEVEKSIYGEFLTIQKTFYPDEIVKKEYKVNRYVISDTGENFWVLNEGEHVTHWQPLLELLERTNDR